MADFPITHIGGQHLVSSLNSFKNLEKFSNTFTVFIENKKLKKKFISFEWTQVMISHHPENEKLWPEYVLRDGRAGVRTDVRSCPPISGWGLTWAREGLVKIVCMSSDFSICRFTKSSRRWSSFIPSIFWIKIDLEVRFSVQSNGSGRSSISSLGASISSNIDISITG